MSNLFLAYERRLHRYQLLLGFHTISQRAIEKPLTEKKDMSQIMSVMPATKRLLVHEKRGAFLEFRRFQIM